ncbi:MAG: response regulator [Fibrobacterales bacterium]
MHEYLTISTNKILIVENKGIERGSLHQDFIKNGYHITVVDNFFNAMERLKTQDFDLIISEVKLTDSNGYKLLSEARKICPTASRLLLTDENIESNMNLIKDYSIENIIPVPKPFDSTEIIDATSKLISKDIFGLEKYLKKRTKVKKILLRSPRQIDEICENLTQLYGLKHNIDKLKVVLTELMTNALFYGAKSEDGSKKNMWDRDFVLPEGEAIEIWHGKDSEKNGIAIIDNGGKLDSKTILYWLDRQITNGEKGFPKGLLDSHGRGLYISRKLADRLIINIEAQKKSECIILNYNEEKHSDSKPIRICEV